MDANSYPNSINKIQDFITKTPIIPVDLDGRGHFSISPIGFPVVNISGSTTPTTVTPKFEVTYKDPKSYPSSPSFSETGEVVPVHRYHFDGTENDNKENHRRKSYSDKEVVDFMRASIADSYEMGKLLGTLQKWFMGNSPVNIGGNGPKSVFVHPFGLNLFVGTPQEHGDFFISQEQSSDVTIAPGDSDSDVISQNR